MSYDEQRFIETWKSVIDFTKVAIGLSTSVLTVVLGLIVVGQLRIAIGATVTVCLLVLSVIFSLLSFGRAIQALSKGVRKPAAIFCSNVAALLLIVSIVLLIFCGQNNDPSIDQILSHINSSAQSLSLPLKPDQCQSIKRVADNYEILYSDSGKTSLVIFSIKKQQIKEIR